MRRPALGRGRPRSGSCPPALSNEKGKIPSIPPSANSTHPPPNPTTALDESLSSLEELEEGEIPPTPPSTNSAPPPPNPTTALDESPSSLEELEEGEIPPTPPSANSAPPPPNPTTLQRLNQHVRGSNSPPEPTLEALTPVLESSQRKLPTLPPDQQQVVQGNGDHNRKRKSSPSTDQAAGHSRPNKKRRANRGQEKKLCHELGHQFIGHVFHLGDQEAWDFANQILQLPIPVTVSKRLVYFCDASVRFPCAAAGIVWPRSLTSPNWGGTGVYYPTSTNSTSTVELFAIARALEMAINDIDKERGSVNHDSLRDKAMLQEGLAHTRSHTHDMTKEVFVFTDDAFALSRIDGKLGYSPEDDLAAEIRAISQFSSTLHGLGVHVELHLSPGHANVPGNVAADHMAKRTQRKLFLQATKSGPKMA